MRWINRKLNWMSYWWFYRRWVKRNSGEGDGFLYLMMLHLREYFEKRPLPESLKSATEVFHKSLRIARPMHPRFLRPSPPPPPPPATK